MSEPAPAATKKSRTGCFIALGVYAILGAIAWKIATNAWMTTSESNQIQQLHSIALSLDSYSDDHNGHYPDGKSSTDVFQQLIDGGYVTDIGVVYAPLDGKIQPTPGKKLQPENVGFDYTAGADRDMPDGLPLIYMTGYRITYTAGAAAIPIPDRSFGLNWFWHRLVHPTPWSQVGISVAFENRKDIYRTDDIKATVISGKAAINPDGSIPNFVPADFKPDGKTYRQLTPDGVLP